MNIRELTCIGCPMGCQLRATLEDGVVTAVTGNSLLHWAAICSSMVWSARMPMVIRVMPGLSVSPETMDSML